MKKPWTAHIVSHTHWDREWYRSFEVFRARLVALVDGLLDLLDREPRFRHFLLDGQTVALEDYLEVLPERRSELERRIREGRIGVGPWYVLPDEFLVGGEALVRNLSLGIRMARAAGGAMRIGYLPDQFGHISQMPQILRGCGIGKAVIWRGLNNRRLPSELLWESPDGSRVLTHLLSIDMGYLNALRLPTDIAKAFARLRNAAAERIRKATSRHLLLMNGVDHAPPDGHLPAMLPALNRMSADTVFRHGSLEEYFAAAQRDRRRRLRVVRGELRDTARNGQIAWLVPGVLSNRMYTKTANHAAQVLLEKWVEPLAAMAWLRGARYPRALIAQAWRNLLRNHPHDTIGGCSVDEVHRDMMRRYSWVMDLGEELMRSSVQRLAGRGPLRAPSAAEPQRLLVFNPLPRPRSEVVFADILAPARHGARRLRILDGTGREVTYQVLEQGTTLAVPEWNPGKFEAARVRVAFFAEHVPPCGWRTYTLSFASPPLPYRGSLSAGPRRIRNERLSVAVAPDGTLEILDRAAGRLWRGLNAFEDGGDAGDLYTYSPPRSDRLFKSGLPRPSVSFVHDGPLFAELRIRHRMALPAGLTAGGHVRSGTRVINTIESRVRLCKGAPWVEIETVVVNRARDHRLRALFPSGGRADHATAGGQFDVPARPLRMPDTSGWVEHDTGARPMQGFVDISDRRGGLAVLAEGLPEYAVSDRPQGTIALTLLRCVGTLHRTGLRTRRDPPGPGLSIPTPDAQCPGRNSFRYALLPHAGSARSAAVPMLAEMFHVPLRAFQAPSAGPAADADPPGSLALDNPHVLVSAIKKAEDRDELVVRLVNTLDTRALCRLRTGFKLAGAWDTDLLENRRNRLDHRVLRLALGPKSVRTVSLRPRARNV